MPRTATTVGPVIWGPRTRRGSHPGRGRSTSPHHDRPARPGRLALAPRRSVRRAPGPMRIFFAVPRSAWVDRNLRLSLEDMGHQLVQFDFPGWPDDADPVWRSRGKPRVNERLLEAFKRAKQRAPIDLV